MNDLMLKSVARLMKIAAFDRCAAALERGDLEEARALLPLMDPVTELARQTPHSARSVIERDTIAAVDALHNLLAVRAA